MGTDPLNGINIACDERFFLLPRPALDLSLPLQRFWICIESFRINERIDGIGRGGPAGLFLRMLSHSPFNVFRRAAVEPSGSQAEYVEPCIHSLKCNKMNCPVTIAIARSRGRQRRERIPGNNDRMPAWDIPHEIISKSSHKDLFLPGQFFLLTGESYIVI